MKSQFNQVVLRFSQSSSNACFVSSSRLAVNDSLCPGMGSDDISHSSKIFQSIIRLRKRNIDLLTCLCSCLPRFPTCLVNSSSRRVRWFRAPSFANGAVNLLHLTFSLICSRSVCVGLRSSISTSSYHTVQSLYTFRRHPDYIFVTTWSVVSSSVSDIGSLTINTIFFARQETFLLSLL